MNYREESLKKHTEWKGKIEILICVGLMLAVVTLLQFVITSAHKERKRIMETV